MSLQLPGTDAGRAGLDRVLAAPSRTLFATDFDGTLSPIVDDPGRAYAHPDAVRVLGRLAGLLAGVVVVTGRPVAEVLRLGGFDGAEGLGGLRILGQYGAERWDAASGDIDVPPPHSGVQRARDALPDLLSRLDLAEAWVEDKHLALAVHVRRLADPDRALAALRDPVAALADEHGLVVEPGKQVLELRAPGTDKGAALRGLLDDGEVDTVVFAGDDVGDVAAFDAVADLRRFGGTGLLLCVRSSDQTALEPRADLVLDAPAGLLGWLDELADALADEPADAPADAPGEAGADPGTRR